MCFNNTLFYTFSYYRKPDYQFLQRGRKEDKTKTEIQISERRNKKKAKNGSIAKCK